MVSTLIISGVDGETFEKFLLEKIEINRPKVLGLAVAYVSMYGFNFLNRIAQDFDIKNIRLVSDIGDAITHPQALRHALDSDWEIRVSASSTSTFHPKFYVGGNKFNKNSLIEETQFYFIGSANLTKGGLTKNQECLQYIKTNSKEPAEIYKKLWSFGKKLSETELNIYEEYFARVNRARSAKDLKILGVADEDNTQKNQKDYLSKKSPPQEKDRTITVEAARAAWVGVESFTGEYTFQIEFPRNAGEVLKRLIDNVYKGRKASFQCEDGAARDMNYYYYHHNSMFRLNVPNDTPSIDWVRTHRTGIILVSQDHENDTKLHFRVIMPGNEADNIMGKSVALGTWGMTRTRFYGWY